MNIGVIGLGKLGLPMVCAFIKKGFNVRGFDINAYTISRLQSRIIDIYEPHIEKIMDSDSEWENRFTNSFDSIYNFSDFIFIIVPTPSKSDSSFDISYVDSLLYNINSKSALGNGAKKTVVIASTVNPGDCEKLSNKYRDINLIYSPEFIALGSVIPDLLNPDLCIIGHNNIDTANKIKNIYCNLYDSTPSYHLLNFIGAETAKISINSYVTMKISYANMIGAYLYKVTNGDRNTISGTLKAIGSDTRINNKYLKFGSGFGGPCFPRDNKCLSHHLTNSSIISSLPESTDTVNDWMVNFYSSVIDHSKFNNIVYVGISYKNGSNFLEESFILKLHKSLFDKNKKYYFIDDNVEKYDGIEKITDLNLLNCSSTLCIVNYAAESIRQELTNFKCFDLWT